MVIFFIRNSVDIDHVTPVIHKVASKNSNNLIVLCLNPRLNIYFDYRLRYLRENYNISIDYAYNILKRGFKDRFNQYIYCNRNNLQNNKFIMIIDLVSRLLSKIIKKIIGNKNYTKIIENNFDIQWANELLEKYKPTVLVFDRIKRYQHNAGVIFDAAKIKGIPLISLPAGINLITSRFHTIDEEKQQKFKNVGDLFKDFDYFVVSNENVKKQNISRGLDERKIKVLGSARFSKEWVEINRKINYQEHKILRNTNKLKVVYMEHYNFVRANFTETVETINTLAKLKFVDLVIKAHTRNNRFQNSYENIQLADSNISSVALCQWADVVIVTVSSIAIEVLLSNTTLLFPQYFNRNSMLFGDMGACWKVDSKAELFSAINKMNEDNNFRPYKRQVVENFLDKSIYNGNSSRDILLEYSNFLNSF